MMKTISWKGQLRKIVKIERETDKAILACIRNVRGLTEEDEKRWQKYREEQLKRLKEILPQLKSQRRRKEAENLIKALEEGWEMKMWIPKSVISKTIEKIKEVV